MNTVQTKVAEQISLISPAVEEKVVGILVDRELTTRSDKLVIVLDKLGNLESDLKKIDKPDMSNYDADGSKVSEYYSKKKLDEVSALKKKITKMSSAVNKALEKGDFSDVNNYAAGKTPSNDNESDTAEAA